MNLILKRGLIAGVVNLIVGFGLNYLIGFVLPVIAKEYQNPAIFRPWTDPLMMIYFAYPFIFGLVSAYFWGIIEGRFKGDEVSKATQFAKLYFLIATIPGMFITYTSFQVSALMVVVWAITGFIEAFIAGYIFAKVKK